MENQVEGEVETTAISKGITVFMAAREDMWGGGESQALLPKALQSGGWQLRGASI